MRNKERPVCNGCVQGEGIDFEETYSPIGILEAIRMFFAFPSLNILKVYDIDVKSSFLDGNLE